MTGGGESVGECDGLAFGSAAEVGRRSMWRDFGAIVLANLASFLLGELSYRLI